MSPPRYDLVTVFFEAELDLLALQARSLARWAEPGLLSEIVVIDNGRGVGLPRRVLECYGPLRPAVRVVRARDLCDLRGVAGWRSQQVLKLEVARTLSSPRYLLLDAKNHLVAPLGRAGLESGDGRLRCGRHSYTEHPLRGDLERTLRFLQLDPAPLLTSYPPTATPFVMDRESVLETLQSVARRGGEDFAAVFERQRLLEFFTYAGILIGRDRWAEVYADEPIESVTVWPRLASARGVGQSLAELSTSEAAFFSVHRTALWRLDRAGRELLCSLWVERGLFPSRGAARAMLTGFRVRYLRGMLARRARERWARRPDAR